MPRTDTCLPTCGRSWQSLPWWLRRANWSSLYRIPWFFLYRLWPIENCSRCLFVKIITRGNLKQKHQTTFCYICELTLQNDISPKTEKILCNFLRSIDSSKFLTCKRIPLLSSLVGTCFRGAFPPVDLRAVCLRRGFVTISDEAVR